MMKLLSYNSLIKTTFTVILFYLAVMVSSCEKDSGPLVIKPDMPPDPADTTISFSQNIQPLFNIHCIHCHNNTHPFLDLRETISYNQLIADGENAPYVDSIQPEDSYLAARLYGLEWPIMPPDPPHFTTTEIDTIIQWMKEGYRDN